MTLHSRRLLKDLLIEIKNITKTFVLKKRKVKEALKGVCFPIFKGEIISLLGVNGAGKTTLSSIIASLHPPTSGEILWKKKSIYKDIISYRRMIGYCPQQPNIDKSLSLEDNLYYSGLFFGLPYAEIDIRKEELIEKFDLGGYRKLNVDVLSGGYKQRFLIARTLMHSPKLVILDEPTVGLDAHIRRQLWQIIQELKREGITILLTTHYLDEAEYLSDRVCIINEGEFITIDTPQNLKKKYNKSNLEEVFLQFLDESQKKLLTRGDEIDV